MGGKAKDGGAVDIDQDQELDAAADGATQDADGAAQRLQNAADEQAGFDAERQHTSAVERMENMARELMLNTDELVFDIRDFLLDQIKARPKPWSGTSQAEQRDVAAACEVAATELVRKVAEHVASNGVPAIRVLLTNFTMAGTEMKISGKVKTFDDEEKDRAITTLSHSLNKHVMLTRASADDYIGGDRPAETDPDEPGFGFEGGDDEQQGDDEQE